MAKSTERTQSVRTRLFLYCIANNDLELTSMPAMESFSITRGKKSFFCSRKSMLVTDTEMSSWESMSSAEAVLEVVDSTPVKSVEFCGFELLCTWFFLRSGNGRRSSVRTQHSPLCSGLGLWNTESRGLSRQWSKASQFSAKDMQIGSEANQFRFWTSLEPYTSERRLQLKSFSTYFSDGFGEQFFLHGLVSKSYWPSHFSPVESLEHCPTLLVSSRSAILSAEQCQWKSMAPQSWWCLFWRLMLGDFKRDKGLSSVSRLRRKEKQIFHHKQRFLLVFSHVSSRSNHPWRSLWFSKRRRRWLSNWHVRMARCSVRKRVMRIYSSEAGSEGQNRWFVRTGLGTHDYSLLESVAFQLQNEQLSQIYRFPTIQIRTRPLNSVIYR